MRALIQRVREASVWIDGRSHSEIGPGILVFLGVHREDTEREAEWILRKLPLLRIFSDEQHPINRSLNDVGGEILLVSQFTLYADCQSGNRPSFTNSAGSEQAEKLYSFVLRGLEALGIPVRSGVFGADMEIRLINDGPVTISLDREPGGQA